ncbi:hypothetical protein CBS147346_1348 [Aspergillus niger]|nr:hypothetical protein CBS147346_1348 [Aspergillus niger]
MNGLAQVLGSLLMYGIGKQHYPRLEPWRVLFLVCVLAMVLYWYLCRAENIKRDQDTRTSAEIVLHTEDITDIEDRFFRYSY